MKAMLLAAIVTLIFAPGCGSKNEQQAQTPPPQNQSSAAQETDVAAATLDSAATDVEGTVADEAAPPPASRTTADWPIPGATTGLRRVQFQKGTYGTTLTGSVTGAEVDAYVLRARVGQTMAIDLDSSNEDAYFAVFSGRADMGGHSVNWSDRLPENGDYTVRVYLWEDEARRGGHANYTLTIDIR